RQRMVMARQLLQRLEQRGPGDGNSYDEFRRSFRAIIGTYGSEGYHLSKWIGGQYFSRNHAGDPGERPRLQPGPAARQREALSTIRQYILAEDAFRFSPNTLNRLSPSRWSHWGQGPTIPMDFPILELVEAIQWNAIERLYQPLVMRRLLNT